MTRESFIKKNADKINRFKADVGIDDATMDVLIDTWMVACANANRSPSWAAMGQICYDDAIARGLEFIAAAKARALN